MKMVNNYFKILRFSEKICNFIVKAKLKKQEYPNSKTESLIILSLNSIFEEKFHGIALDFDGTLIPLDKRDQLIEPIILQKLKILNSRRIPIMILTGRGSSVIRQITLNEFLFRNLVYIAQYNGGKAILGNGNNIFEYPIENFNGYTQIKEFLAKKNIVFNEKISSFVILNNIKSYEIVNDFISKFKDWRIVNTNYSYDIIPEFVSKHAALIKGCEIFGIIDMNKILKIGDAGDKQGNDYDFLKLKNSYSVDKFSSDINTNFPIINEKGCRLKGPEGLKFILDHINI